MLAMALLMPGGLLGGMAGEAGGVDGSGEGCLAASENGEPAHLLRLCLFLAFPQIEAPCGALYL